MNRFEVGLFAVMLTLTSCVEVHGQSYLGSVHLSTDTGRGERVGTAFVAGANHNVFTAAHVASPADTLWYTPVDSQYIFRIHREFSLPGYDLAVFSRTGGQQPSRINFGDFNRLRPGDTVRYSGWKSGEAPKVHQSAVLSIGSTISDGVIVDYVEFVGEILGGYSGGPVLNLDGHVVAMIHGYVRVLHPKTGKELRVIRAFSIEPLRIIEDHMEKLNGR